MTLRTLLAGTLLLGGVCQAATTIFFSDFQESAYTNGDSVATNVVYDTTNGLAGISSTISFTHPLRGSGEERMNVNQNIGTSDPWTATIDFTTAGNTIDLTRFLLDWQALNSSNAANAAKTTNWTVEIFNRTGATLGSSIGSANVNSTSASTSFGTLDLDLSPIADLAANSEYRLALTAAEVNSPGHFAAFDNITLEAATIIPEPSVCLLGCFGVAVLFRRKR